MLRITARRVFDSFRVFCILSFFLLQNAAGESASAEDKVKSNTRPNKAIVFLLDKSKSMQVEERFTLAQHVISSALEMLSPDDYVMVIAFDDSPFMVIALSQVREAKQLAKKRLRYLFPTGQSNPLPAFILAHQRVQKISAMHYQFLFISDGKIPWAQEQYAEILDELEAAKIILSAVILDDEADAHPWKKLITNTNGNFYWATDPRSVEKILLKEFHPETAPKAR